MIALQVLNWMGLCAMAFALVSFLPMFPAWAGLGKPEHSTGQKLFVGAVVAGWISIWFNAIKGFAIGWIPHFDHEAGAGIFAIAFLIGGLCFDRVCNLHKIHAHDQETPLARIKRLRDAPLIEQGRLSPDHDCGDRLQARFIPKARRPQIDDARGEE